MFCVQEMERVWGQYERMESELSVIRSHLQHICNFGVPQVIRKKNSDPGSGAAFVWSQVIYRYSLQEQCQAQRELWMMEDILAGLKINKDHFCFLLGLQRHHSKTLKYDIYYIQRVQRQEVSRLCEHRERFTPF